MVYARHQSFYMRDKWFSKGLRAVRNNGSFFYDDLAFEKIGLGKNMVESLRYWLTALKVIEERTSETGKEYVLTELGQLLYTKDILLQRNETLSILHYQLVKNDGDQSTVFEWFFNRFKETTVNKSELLHAFITWVEKKETKKISEKSLKRDIDCLIQFYTKTPDVGDPEDVLFSPFFKLRLMSIQRSGEGFDTIKKNSPEITEVGLNSLYYILLEYRSTFNDDLIGVDEIIYGENLWGKTFNLTRDKVIEALDNLTNHHRYPLQYVRTNNLDYVKVPTIAPIEYLKAEF